MPNTTINSAHRSVSRWRSAQAKTLEEQVGNKRIKRAVQPGDVDQTTTQEKAASQNVLRRLHQRWTRSAPQESPLCDRCSRLKSSFEKLFNRDYSKATLLMFHSLPFGPTNVIDCALCRLLVEVSDPASSFAYLTWYCSRSFPLGYPEQKLDSYHYIVGVSNSTSVRSSDTGRDHTDSLTTAREHIESFDTMRDRGFIVMEGHSMIQQPHVSHLFTGSQVEPDSINYELLQSWLDNCDRSHTYCAPVKADGDLVLMHLRCLDCATREVVEIQPDDQYLALSYVWGSPVPAREDDEVNTRKKTSQPPNKMPQVIEDALIVVQSLGKRYLWVDKYCIDQEDKQESTFSFEIWTGYMRELMLP